MDATPNLLLPYIMPSQAQKSVTHNEALRTLDALVMLSVKSRSLAAPPEDPANGERYIVAAPASGAWEGQAGAIAAMQDGAWNFIAPAEGWLGWCEAEAGLVSFSGGAWGPLGPGAGDIHNLEFLGINATADPTNRLSVASDATLFSHDGADHRVVVNKQAAADTASFLFQNDFSGRAEIGLNGDDRLSVKVSADGASFATAIEIDPVTAKARFPQNKVLENYALNLYQDAGRMAGGSSAAQTVGAFAWPSYLTLNNGAAVAARAKFIFNNTDYGGSAGALHPDAKSLIDQLREPAYRRYNIEFWIAIVTAGSGTTSSPVTIGASTAYMSLYTSFRVRPPALTHHAYLKALDDDIFVNVMSGQVLRKNGAVRTAPFAIAPADGWVSVMVHDEINPRLSFGYQPTIFSVYTKTAGHRYLLACPALMPGITDVDENIGVIASANGWPG